MIRLLLLLFITLPVNAQQKIERVPGAGPSTMVVTRFFELFEKTEAAEGYQFTVPQRSVKHSGGIKASSHYLFGRTGRPLKKDEKAMGKHELLLASIPLVFATGNAITPQQISKDKLHDIFTRETKHWTLASGSREQIILIGRESTEVVLSELVKTFPFLNFAIYDRTFTRDHQVVNFLKSKAGQFAIGFGAKPNFHQLNQLSVEGVNIGLPIGLVIDESHRNHPIVKAVQDYAQSKKWQNEVLKMGYIPIQQAL